MPYLPLERSCPNPYYLWICYFTSLKEWLNVGYLGWRNYYWFSKWAHSYHIKPLIAENHSLLWSERCVKIERRLERCVVPFGDGENGPKLEARKVKDLQKWTQCYQYLILAQWEPCWNFDLWNCKIINVYCFKLLNLW